MSTWIRMSSMSKGLKWQFSWCSGDARRQVLLGGASKGRVRKYERSNTVKGPYRCSLLALWYMWEMGFLQGSEQKVPSVTLALRRDCAGGFRGHYSRLGEGELRHCWQLEGVWLQIFRLWIPMMRCDDELSCFIFQQRNTSQFTQSNSLSLENIICKNYNRIARSVQRE